MYNFDASLISSEVGSCPICGKQFSNPKSARRHVKEIHEGQKRIRDQFKCQICGRDFIRRYLLNEHTSLFHPEFITEKKKKNIIVVQPDIEFE